MLRCVAHAAVAAAIAALPAAVVLAQPVPDHRVFPVNALRGELVVQEPPAVTLNGRAERLAPGVRVRNADNLVVPAVMLADQRLTVHYTREAATGLLLELWVLRPSELQNRPWPTKEDEARSWSFDLPSQRWTRP